MSADVTALCPARRMILGEDIIQPTLPSLGLVDMNNQLNDPDYPEYLIAIGTKAITIPSPQDGQDGLVACYSRRAAEIVARSMTEAVIVRATPEMFVEACRKANRIGVPYLYLGRESGDDVYFERVRLALALGQVAGDGQHRRRKG